MIVTEAVSAPCTQSSLLTGGKSEAWVGPGVGNRLTMVQPGIMSPLTSSATDTVAVASAVDVDCSVAEAWAVALGSVVTLGKAVALGKEVALGATGKVGAAGTPPAQPVTNKATTTKSKVSRGMFFTPIIKIA